MNEIHPSSANNQPSSASALAEAHGAPDSARSRLKSHFKNAHVHFCAGWSSALYTALLSCNIEPGDEVIIPALAPAGVAHAVLLAKARPVLVDVAPDTLLLAPEAVLAAITERTRCVVLCHLYGQVAPQAALHEDLSRRSIALVEDGSDAFLALGVCEQPAAHCDLLVGCLPGMREVEGELPAFIVTRNASHHARMSYWTAQHDVAERLFQFDAPDMEEAPYVDLVSSLDETQDAHFQTCISYSLNTRELIGKQAAIYDESFAGLGLKTLPLDEIDVRISQSFPIAVDPALRDALFELLYHEGFKVHVTYRNLGQLKFFQRSESGDIFPNAARWSAGAISLPTGNRLCRKEQMQLCATVKNFLTLQQSRA
ncbi:DegT/DnrJ/EryC1/StrS family aminotransferase [Cohaesibacter haloalkalitolerans]|uniref:DegT/DnrJ/EryC1/StrS family aminotransferase n=1 Tax=Cohaesibacter haloalkalitolerans TaxID=1162980 RepID=UPI000E650478|nr:DegT/DnrJ/EryC1/StrS family aminotransferase [Cohaesibacter haloalkalitolerans]